MTRTVIPKRLQPLLRGVRKRWQRRALDLPEPFATVFPFTQASLPRQKNLVELARTLEREEIQLRATLRDFANRRHEASVQADLERRQLGEQFRVLEAAFPPIGPSAPNRLMALAMSLLAGLALGAGAGILAESLDGSVHGARELQAALGVPVLVTIPAIVLESDRARAVRRRIQTAVAAAAFAVFCLVGGAVTYMAVNGAPGWIQSLVAGEEDPESAAVPRDATPSVAAR